MSNKATDMAKDKNYRRFINSARWRHTRNAYLLEHPLCEACSTDDTPVIARCVHHKTPAETARSVREMETLMFATTNLQALCYDCHKNIHYQERSHTKEVVKERERTRVQRFIQAMIAPVRTTRDTLPDADATGTRAQGTDGDAKDGARQGTHGQLTN